MPQQATLVRSTYAPWQRHPRHAHPWANVSVVLAGSLVERVGHSEFCAGPLHMVVKPAGTDHADVFGAKGAVLLQLILSAEWLAELQDGSRAADRWRWLSSPAATRWMLRLAGNAPGGPHPASDCIAECLGAVGCESAAVEPVPQWLALVRERIREERGRGARVAELARDAGVHPVYLTRRFRRAYGCSVVACIQAERVRAAADAVASSNEPIAQISHGVGFADQSHLTRAFKRVAGLTPANYRRLSRSGSVEFVLE